MRRDADLYLALSSMPPLSGPSPNTKKYVPLASSKSIFLLITSSPPILYVFHYSDSKQLKEGVREALFEKIRQHKSIGWVIHEIPATTISSCMLKPSPTSLNSLSYQGVVSILEKIRDEENASIINNIYIDTVGDPEFYKSTLCNALGKDFANFTIEKKADATYRVVSAASIVAKVTRDTLMKEFIFDEPSVKLTKDYGSGYPGDPECVEWLKNAQEKVFGFPNIVRFSWSTSREALLRGNIACLVKWECEEDETLGGADITSFFPSSSNGSGMKRAKRSSFFTKRKMKLAIPSDFHN